MIAQSAAPATQMRRRQILGLGVDDLSWAEALDQIAAWTAPGEAGPPRQVITLNPEHVMRAHRDPAFRAAIAAADMVSCDGVGLAWAGRRLGQPLRAVIPGSELMGRLAAHTAGRAPRWFLLGGSAGVAEEAAAVLRRGHPGLVIAGTYAGSPTDAEAPEILARMRAAGPIDLLWVAYGSPAQELWIARHRAAIPARVAIGVGGAFNFLAGRSQPPPDWVRRAGLIWLHRLVREPWRWRRQLALVRFVALVLAARRRRPGDSGEPGRD